MQAPEVGPGPVGPMTWEEFLTLEGAAAGKHEYVGGYAWPWGHIQQPWGLAGANRRHNQIAMNVLGELWTLARRTPELGCRVYGSDMLVRVGDEGYYPDAQVACEPEQGHEQYNERPCLIVEVLSDSTARVDRGEKLLAYEGITTLKTYVIVSQKERRVVRYWRAENGGWAREDVTAGSVAIACLSAALTVDAIYAGVE